MESINEKNNFHENLEIVPSKKPCRFCHQLLTHKLGAGENIVIYCFSCNKLTKWNYNTLLAKTSLNMTKIEFLIRGKSVATLDACCASQHCRVACHVTVASLSHIAASLFLRDFSR